MAIHTPVKPIVGTNTRASVRRTTQMLPRFMMLGMRVFPEPTKTPYATMLAANIGSAHASMRRISAPSFTTLPSVVIICISSGANTPMSKPINAMMAIPKPTDIHAKLRMRSFRLAPRLCPTSVVAASEMP